MYTTICGCKGKNEVLSRVIVIGDWPSETDEDDNRAVENAAS